MEDHGFLLGKDENSPDGDDISLKFFDDEAQNTTQTFELTPTEEPKKKDSAEADARRSVKHTILEHCRIADVTHNHVHEWYPHTGGGLRNRAFHSIFCCIADGRKRTCY